MDKTSELAIKSPRLRMNFNFHPNLEDPINRMLNAMEPGTYIQPHKHESPEKFEVFLVLRGRFVAICFDEVGNIADFTLLDANVGKFGVEIPGGTLHTLISLESGSVAYEVKSGPYQPITAKNFAPFAPAEGDPDVAEYLKKLLSAVGL